MPRFFSIIEILEFKINNGNILDKVLLEFFEEFLENFQMKASIISVDNP